MRLISLDISNFRVLRRVHLEFPDAVTGIIGQNGSGKSSIVEAIAWALYGNQVARSSKDEIKSSFAGVAECCEVSLVFEINREHYRVVRRLTGRSERPEVELYRGAAAESVGSTETRSHIEQLLGLDWRGFLTSFLARQQELNALSDLPAAKRRDHLAGMLGIGRLDKAIQHLKEDIRMFGEKANYIERQLAQKEGVEERVRELREHAHSLKSQQDALVGACRAAKLKLDEMTSIYREHEARKSTCSQLTVRIEAQQDAARHLEEQVQSLSSETAALQQAKEELDGLTVALNGFEQLRQQFEHMREAKSRAAQRATIREQVESIKVESDELERGLKANQRAVDERTADIRDIPDDIERLCEKAGESLDSARSEWAHLQAESKATDRELEKVKNQIASIAEIGPEAVCDRCHRPFGDDLPAIRAHLDRECQQFADRLGALKEQMRAERAEGERLKKEFTELDRQLKRRFELQTQLEAMRKEKRDLHQRLKDTSQRFDRLSAQLAELGEIEFDQAEFERIRARVAEQEKLNEQRTLLTGRLRRLEPANDELRRSRQNLSAVTAEIEKLREEQLSLGYDQAQFDRTASDFTAAQQQFEKEKEARLEIDKKLELILKEIDLRCEQVADLEKVAEELEAIRVSRYHGERLSRLFADFRKHLIARIRPRLAEISSELLSEMTAGKYNLAELDEDYNLRILDYSRFFGVDRFSGGEKDLANLCLRLAISLALSESAGLERSFVILDEIFGSQDDERRDLIFKGLVNLKNRFPQILLITHIDEIRDKVEYLVELRPTDAGWSEVIVNGESI